VNIVPCNDTLSQYKLVCIYSEHDEYHKFVAKETDIQANISKNPIPNKESLPCASVIGIDAGKQGNFRYLGF